jgi:integrase
VDWEANLIRLEKRQTKAKQARLASLYGELRSWLEMAYGCRPKDCPFGVSWNGQGVAQIKTAWNKARQRAGVPELLVRDLRRTAARNMIRAGVPEKQVMLIAGWKTRSLLDRYNVVDERDVIAAGQKLDRYASELADKVRTKFVQREDKGEPVEFVN